MAEATDFCRGTMALDLPDADINALHQRTEGWVAGLQLAALSIRDSDDAQQLIHSLDGSHRYILDYLIEEVFQRQPPDVRRFLLQTSILERFGAPLCDAVTGRSDAHQVLLSLEHANLFLVPLDASRAWYRYHRLFADLLRHRAQVALGTQLPELHRQASQWYADHGHAVDAVRHALAASDWESAADLIASGASTEVLGRGEVTTLLRWCRALPDEVMRAHPAVSLEYAWALILSEQADGAEAYLDLVERATQQAPDASLAGGLAVARVHIARVRGDQARATALAERALAVLPKEDLSSRSVLAVNLGIAQWYGGRLFSAERTLEEARRAGKGSGNDYVYLAARIFATRTRTARGSLRQGAAAYREIIDQARGHPVVALAYLDLARLCYEWDDLSGAAAHARQGIELGQRAGSPELLAAGYATLASIVAAQGAHADAAQAMQEANRLIELPGLSPAAHLYNLVARLQVALTCSDIDAALLVSERAPRPEEAASFPDYLSLGLGQVRLLLAQGRELQAAAAAKALQDRAAAAGWEIAALAASVMRALAARAPRERIDRLAETLALTEPEGYVRTYVDLGAPMAAALREAAARGIAPAYVGRLLGAFDGAPAPVRAVSLPYGLPPEPLSDREKEVLRLLVTGQTYQEIALTISVSLNTVKTHLKHIYAKLGVSDRRAAAAHARQLGLVR
jgi:LuxR family maltose regulon positive regulatory protein